MKTRHFLVAMASVASLMASADTLYTVQEGNNIFTSIDSDTGTVTGIGALGVGYEFGDIAFDPTSNTMYMIDGWGAGFRATNSLYKIDMTTGAASLVGSTGTNDLFGLAYDPVSNKLFASRSTTSSGFFDINKSTGAASFIGDPGRSLDGMTYVGSTGDVLGFEAGPGSFWSVDRNTGASSLVNVGSGFVNNGGIAYVGSTNSVYAIDWSGDFYRYDVGAGYSRTTVVNLGQAYDGLAAVPEPASMIALGVGVLAFVRRRRK